MILNFRAIEKANVNSEVFILKDERHKYLINVAEVIAPTKILSLGQ